MDLRHGDRGRSGGRTGSAANRHAPALGGRTVAVQDFSLTSSPLEPEVVTASLGGGAAIRLTTNNRLERDIAVSPDGAAIAWTDCNTSGLGCDVWAARRAGGTWTTSNLTANAAEEGTADTNGALIAYNSTRAGETDVYFQPVSGGAEKQLALAGVETNPNLSGELLSFERALAPAAARDIYVYDTAADALYQVTNTPNDEFLSDISVSSTGLARVVWHVQENGNFNVRAKSFQLPAAKTPAQLLADLVALVQSFNLKQGIANSLDAKLGNAQKALDAARAGDKATACNLLGAFVNEVQAQAGKALTADQANQLITAANGVKAALGCV